MNVLRVWNFLCQVVDECVESMEVSVPSGG